MFKSIILLPVMSAIFALSMPATSISSFADDIPEPDFYTGAIFDKPEQVAGKQSTAIFRSFLPVAVDLSNRFPRVGDQGKQGSCVGWSVGYAARSYYSVKDQVRKTSDQIASPAYIYNNIRLPDRSGQRCQNGSYITDALNLLMKGSVSHKEYPYNQYRCSAPGPSVKAKATKFKIKNWRVVDAKRQDQIKAQLAKGNPVIVGLSVNKTFMRLRGKRVWRDRSAFNRNTGHAMTLVGYDERKQYFKLINSWGKRWGNRGFGYVSYDTFNRKTQPYAYVMTVADAPIPPKPDVIVPPKPEDAPVSDEIKKILDQLSEDIGCGKLKARKLDGQIIIEGFAGKKEDLKKITNALKDKKINIKLSHRPWPQCETLMTLDDPLERVEKPTIILAKKEYQDADLLKIEVKMAAFQGYLHVAYVQADGNVVNLVNSDPLSLKTLDPNSRLLFGDGKEGRAKFTISKPFGNEMIVAISSKSPLFEQKRPTVETEREFLTALRKAILARPYEAAQKRFLSANYVTLKTRDKLTGTDEKPDQNK